MTVNPELLRRAWPDGYLAMRGVATIGNWSCVYVGESRDEKNEPMPGKRHAIWRYFTGWELACSLGEAPDWRYRPSNLDAGVPAARVAEIDDLLPVVDPSETATWACLLRDLAEAVNGRERLMDDVDPFTFNLNGGFTFASDGVAYCWMTDDAGNRHIWAMQSKTDDIEWVKRGEAWLGYLPSNLSITKALVFARIYEREWAERNG